MGSLSNISEQPNYCLNGNHPPNDLAQVAKAKISLPKPQNWMNRQSGIATTNQSDRTLSGTCCTELGHLYPDLSSLNSGGENGQCFFSGNHT
jgi:hypothetical protein